MTVTNVALMAPEGFLVPALHGPVEVRMRTEADRVQESLLQWSSFHGLFWDSRQRERYAHIGFLRFAGYACPQVTALKTVAWWHGHHWLVDDFLDHPRTGDAQAEALVVGLPQRSVPRGAFAANDAISWTNGFIPEHGQQGAALADASRRMAGFLRLPDSLALHQETEARPT